MTNLQTALPGSQVTLEELRALAQDGTALRYALMELSTQIPDAIALGRGDPDLDTPAHVIAAAQAAVDAGLADQPTAPNGMLALREAIAAIDGVDALFVGPSDLSQSLRGRTRTRV